MRKYLILYVIFTLGSLIAIGIIGYNAHKSLSAQLNEQNFRAYVTCESMYDIPCDKDGQLKTDLTINEIDNLLAKHKAGQLPLRDDEVKFLQILRKTK